MTSSIQTYSPIHFQPTPSAKEIYERRASRQICEGVVLALRRAIEPQPPMQEGTISHDKPTNESEQEEEDLKHEEEHMEEDLQSADYIVHALASYANPQTIKIGGFLKLQPITIFVDTESTSNFMNNKVCYLYDALDRGLQQVRRKGGCWSYL
ncbi:hypothetical protein BHE74_00047510 [Ensete ventricosum]|nr:hypothetical protein GW17_00025839 [Ensete ventricosum]RWW46557.1 hypothetical protein BHE74_00047510 [Ensete ventricosum]